MIYEIYYNFKNLIMIIYIFSILLNFIYSDAVCDKAMLQLEL